MAQNTVNVLLATFPGLGLPKTVSFQTPTSSTISDLFHAVHERLPSPACDNLIISTTSNKQVLQSSDQPLSNLLSAPSDQFITLRLSSRLCGGKGGFGSQLRAQGGRMSSRKKKKQGDPNASSRNLDGRRLRTITEAKALAEYLAVKPEMDKKEKEERLKRWEDIVEMTEKKQEDLKSGGKARLDGKWLEAKEEAAEKTREAILEALKAGEIDNLLGESDESDDGSDEEGSSENDTEMQDANKSEDKAGPSKVTKTAPTRSFHGWEEEELSDSEEDDEDSKGKINE